ncbi:MAG: carboxypeptidase regulatory-like domain-containing protein [Gemmatimonadaceae bacterium]
MSLPRLTRRLAAAASLAFGCAATLAVAARPAAAQSADVIRGRVVGPDSVPVEAAQVTVTSITGNVSRSARTDRNGRFTVTFPGGDGDYMVSFAAMGFAARRFEIKRVADEEILVADARLQRVAAVLDAVQVRAPRERVSRADAAQPDVGGTEQPVTSNGLPAADLGDLAAMAATLPGVQLVPGENGDPNGFSVLGLGADQNQTTLNGLSFGGANLPRDAAVSSSLTTSPYDVSRGGFSGAQFSLRTQGGSNFRRRGMSLLLDTPQLQWTDPAARALGQQYSNVSLGGAASGPLSLDKAFYNVSFQLGRRESDWQSLLNTGSAGLAAAGVSADSAQRLSAILAGEGVPLTVGGAPSERLSDNGSVFGSVDVAPPTSTAGHAFNLSFNGSWNRQNPAGGQATELPAFSGTREGVRGGLQGRHTGYLTLKGVGILSETSIGASGSVNDASPYLRMPAGRVRVGSLFDDGGSSVANLSFGGSPSLDSRQTSTQLQALNQLSWFSANNRHRLKLTSELRHESSDQRQATNTLGTWSFNSLEDVEAGRPASYTRQLAPRERSASQVVLGASLGDAWRPRRDFQLAYGVRVDANRFLDEPARNEELTALFGVRNDRVPNRAFVSPRVGFSWTVGQAAQVASFEGAMRGPRAVVRGGVGLFQNTPRTEMIGGALESTGLPGAVQQLTCVGDAAPVPDWDAYAANPGLVPDRCADGTTGGVFATSAPNVTLFAKDYEAPRSVRSNLGWSGPLFGNRLSATIDGTYSRNMHQPGFVDLNFKPEQRFAIEGEENRPVFVNPSSIFPATGAVSPTEARVSPLYSRVSEQRSDLTSESRQLQLRVSPISFSTKLTWGASYTYSNVRDQVRGFQSNTAGNPLAVEWARSAFDSRHQFTYSLNYNAWDLVRFSWFGQVRSGTPFTPTVGGDVNGDGYVNDRAFVFDPANPNTDPAVAAGIRALLENGSSAARACLQSQLDHVARRNSCEGPWSQTATLGIAFNPLKVRMPQRATLSFQVSNPLGAADLLVNGENALKGWGQTASPDQALLYVRGFDPAGERYVYEVNQRFGATRPQFSQFRSPVTVSAMLRFDVGPTRERQLLTQQLDRGRTRKGDRMPEPMLRAMYGGGGVPNPLTQILRQQDSLKLTSTQADSIASLSRWYTVRLDSIWAPVARYFAALPDRYDEDAAYYRYVRARRASIDMLASLAPHVSGLLTPAQRRMLPSQISVLLDRRYLASIRSGTAGFNGGMPGMPMMGGPGGGGPGVTVERVIIRQ